MINWQQFGLRSNPYDTNPITEGGELPIDQAFVGRKAEIKTIQDVFLSDSRACLAILGNVGVGKTSLANYSKYILKSGKKGKILFSFRREMEASKNLLNKRNFLIEIIGSTLREIKLLDPDLIKKEELLQKLGKIVDITQSMDISVGVSIAGFGGEYAKHSTTEYPSALSMSMLEGCFFDLITYVKSHKIGGKVYSGLIVHVNNFDVVLSDKANRKSVLDFFQEIRDILQTKDVYFMFLGPSNFYQDVLSREPRVKSVFHLTPMTLSPLTKKEVVKALEERITILKSNDVVVPIQPVNDEVIYKLYDLYNGDVRSIMTGLTSILSQVSETIIEPLGTEEALLLLGKERWESLKMTPGLTNEKEEILKFIAGSGNLVTVKEIIERFKKAPANISGYYFAPLKDAGIIEVKKTEGKTKYWGLTQTYEPIRYLLQSRESIQSRTENDLKQLQLFNSK